MKRRDDSKIMWQPINCYIVFIQTMYKEAGLTIPEEFYPEIEAPRLADALRCQGMGIEFPDE